MAGLYIKELIIRGDVKRCLVCCPGNLVQQWQDELYIPLSCSLIASSCSIREGLACNRWRQSLR